LLTFKSVRWKNFLSTGDKFTEVNLNDSPTTLIVGANGSGKSTMLDAISFGLFGKAHRDIKKQQLINSVNGKHATVEIEFSVGVNNFMIRRMIKPTKFEIHQNGKMLNQDSNARDYQKLLEQNIIKMNHKSFHQIVVLGSSNFIPFMQLSAAERRNVIEELLDINIFSKMNNVLKEMNAKTKDEYSLVGHEIDMTSAKLDGAQKYIKDLKGINVDLIESKRDSLKSYQTEIQSYQVINADHTTLLSAELEGATNASSQIADKISEQNRTDGQLKSQIKGLVKDAKFFNDNDNCPTCDSDLSPEFKADHLKTIKTDAASVSKEMTSVATLLTELYAENETALATLSTLNEKQSEVNSNNRTIALLQDEISKINAEISTLNTSTETGDLAKAQKESDDLLALKNELTEKKLELNETRIYNDAIGEMLKDTGIKTKVIKQYLPVMNKFINSYLQTLDFFVAFNLDENFNETIKSRHRDEFNYSSFSEGEKQRIDLALLFTWRQIAKMKNSASTNLLVLDETFDSSLDVDGVENLTKILATLDIDSNTFIISHKGDLLENKFENKLTFFKEGNFSKVKKDAPRAR
tara:strand:+ start:2778 stop:4520 length:1743 start_codon:yes stop_codon:yes gene_type:complete